jgi:hypothetical protein
VDGRRTLSGTDKRSTMISRRHEVFVLIAQRLKGSTTRFERSMSFLYEAVTDRRKLWGWSSEGETLSHKFPRVADLVNTVLGWFRQNCNDR